MFATCPSITRKLESFFIAFAQAVRNDVKKQANFKATTIHITQEAFKGFALDEALLSS